MSISFIGVEFNGSGLLQGEQNQEVSQSGLSELQMHPKWHLISCMNSIEDGGGKRVMHVTQG